MCASFPTLFLQTSGQEFQCWSHNSYTDIYVAFFFFIFFYLFVCFVSRSLCEWMQRTRHQQQQQQKWTYFVQRLLSFIVTIDVERFSTICEHQRESINFYVFHRTIYFRLNFSFFFILSFHQSITIDCKIESKWIIRCDKFRLNEWIRMCCRCI